ncbi:MAG: ATP-binding cassette domain-containing protein [Ignavibacteria bacterium]|nr:ATP-binding cassette domain-containing protein [Ignavibacteria bacterium]MBT8383060.1 ATP-binding cassette domain-containing protein [Ignavibacteria bacterium]MBT8392401.1 ATP-binding cassette domain-containing protein [Ignavibacteria bacterium]NNJ52654.1 ATP-binding cassette domain-containing protein [Ignavibacteriaceae bacterium]NNL22175.1 ATP-binding cassette domain-containing protein [Ignavibacteriaceae bacterium]
MLVVKNLTKKFKDTIAVNNLSFTIKPGKIFGLLGPNGAGKTTTLRTVLNIIKPTSGTISFDGKSISDEYYNMIGYLPEERGLYQRSKVIDILAYFASLKNLSKSDALFKADEWLKKLNVSRYRNKKIIELSKGNQQKIQLIAAIVHNPRLLILDEPFTGFDPINQQEVKELILTFTSEGKTIILSTHQMELAEKMCENILLMNKGSEVKSGKLSEIKRIFGGNNVKVEFSGERKLIDGMPEVLKFDSYNNYSEIHLKDEVSPSKFLKQIIQKVDVKHFSVIEPTLNKIFIDLINENN